MKKFYLLFFCIILGFAVNAQITEEEFQALKAFYNSTGGDNWTNRTGWENINTTATKDDVNGTWKGIEIENGHVVRIYLYNNNLTGSLPSQIGNLQWLTELSVYDNSITGKLPDEIGDLLQLTLINISDNKIEGPLPEKMKQISKLQYFYISENPLNCPFPNDLFGYWPDLFIFSASGCGLTDSISVNFPNLKSLYQLLLYNNKLTGTVPDSISFLKNLYALDLSYNQFSGNLPSLDSCQILRELILNNNFFTGEIPEQFLNATTTLLTIYLSENKIYGKLPEKMFTSLQNAYLDKNYFTFEHFEPIINQLRNVYRKGYANQKKVLLKQTEKSVEAGESLVINAAELTQIALGGNNNRYKWFKNNAEVYSGNSPEYVVPAAGADDAGIYRFEVSNTVVTEMTLTSENISVSVTGINHTPTDIILSSTSVNENYTGEVATLSAADADVSDVHTFSLETGNGTNDQHNYLFSIQNNKLLLNTQVNYENITTLKIVLSANDNKGGVFTKAITIQVTNIDEAPEFATQNTSASIDETASNATVVLNLLASDPEGNAVTFSIISGNENGAFGIEGSALVVADNTQLDYNTKNQYSLTIEATEGTMAATKVFTISLNKINEVPEVENAVFVLDENTANGTLVGTITATDPENMPLTIAITSGNTGGAFSIDGKNLVVANQPVINFEENTVFQLTISVSDGISTVPATITVYINNLPDETGNDILSFSVPGLYREPEIDPVAQTIYAVKSQTDITALQATFTLSEAATSNPESGSVLNFLTPVTITVTAENGTPKVWTVYVSDITAVDLLKQAGISVYPNPADSYIQISGVPDHSALKIIDIKGNIIRTISAYESGQFINIEGLKPGLYIVSCETDQKFSFAKFVKQ